MIERGSYAITGAGYVQNRYGRIMVMLMLSNGQPGQVLPWHLHHGTCGRAAGDMVGPASAYPPVTIQADGSALASAEVYGVSLYPTAQYHVDVHSSAYDTEGIVACANLTARPLGSGRS